jgi:hypothetical protein
MSVVLADRSPGASELQYSGVLVDLDLERFPIDGEPSPVVRVKFFVDTGSTMCAIRPSIADQLKPPLYEQKLQATGIDGTVKVPSFYGIIRCGDQTIGGQMTIHTLPNGENDYDGIIGRDVLRRLVLLYDGPNGRYTITMP